MLTRNLLCAAALAGFLASCEEDQRYPDPPAGSFSPIMVQLKALGDSQPVPMAAARVSGKFFPFIAPSTPARPGELFVMKKKPAIQPGQRPMPLIGRYFVPADLGVDGVPVVVISNELWNARFGRDPAVIGTTVEINGTPTFIIGVGPPGYAPAKAGLLWLPAVTRP